MTKLNKNVPDLQWQLRVSPYLVLLVQQSKYDLSQRTPLALAPEFLFAAPQFVEAVLAYGPLLECQL